MDRRLSQDDVPVRGELCQAFAQSLGPSHSRCRKMIGAKFGLATAHDDIERTEAGNGPLLCPFALDQHDRQHLAGKTSRAVHRLTCKPGTANSTAGLSSGAFGARKTIGKCQLHEMISQCSRALFLDHTGPEIPLVDAFEQPEVETISGMAIAILP